MSSFDSTASFLSEEDHADNEDSGEEDSNLIYTTEREKENNFLNEDNSEQIEEEEELKPKGMYPMASWYEYGLAQTVIDLIIHTTIFAGRFDMRHLLSARSTFDTDIRGVEPGSSTDPHYHDHTSTRDNNGR